MRVRERRTRLRFRNTPLQAAASTAAPTDPLMGRSAAHTGAVRTLTEALFMKRILFVLATAGIIVSGAAAAAPSAHRDSTHYATIEVQYQDRWDGRFDDRWDGRVADVDQREAQINARIQRGASDGRLTAREARRLHRQLVTIEYKERGFKADGRLTRRENMELNRDLDLLSENVRAELRDGQRY
jgi:hypothetical protein